MAELEDLYLQRLAEVTEELKMCQHAKFPEAEIPSCMACDALVGCELRRRYVEAVYQSMNKNQGGGFEF